jgi:hypothetical protein
MIVLVRCTCIAAEVNNLIIIINRNKNEFLTYRKLETNYLLCTVRKLCGNGCQCSLVIKKKKDMW